MPSYAGVDRSSCGVEKSTEASFPPASLYVNSTATDPIGLTSITATNPLAGCLVWKLYASVVQGKPSGIRLEAGYHRLHKDSALLPRMHGKIRSSDLFLAYNATTKRS